MRRYRCGLVLVLALATTSLASAQDPFGDISDLKIAKPEDKVDVATTPAPTSPVTLKLSRLLRMDGNRKPSRSLYFELKFEGCTRCYLSHSEVLRSTRGRHK